MGVRREARERALSLLYEAEIRGCEASDLLAELPVPPDDYAVDLFVGVARCEPELDALVGGHARHWSMGRMAALDRNLLRMGAYELLHHPEVPVAVVISESVELAKLYSTDESGRFVNGVLGALALDVRGDQVEASPTEAAGEGGAAT